MPPPSPPSLPPSLPPPSNNRPTKPKQPLTLDIMGEPSGKAGDGVPAPMADGGAGGVPGAVPEGGKKRSPNRLIVDEATNDDNR